MNMPGMHMSSNASGMHMSSGAPGMHMSSGAPGMHMSSGAPGMHLGHLHVLNLLPSWVGILWTVMCLVIVVSHMRHLIHVTGQRRAWHACHVLMAVGMAVMYAPSQIDPFGVPSSFWQAVFAAACVGAAVWAIAGVGLVSTWIWLLTSLDLGVMLFMWTSTRDADTSAPTWLLAGYLIVQALMWMLDLYRRLDGAVPLIGFGPLAIQTGDTMAVALRRRAGSVTLLGTHDISVSMIAMAIGMAYMLVAMQMMA